MREGMYLSICGWIPVVLLRLLLLICCNRTVNVLSFYTQPTFIISKCFVTQKGNEVECIHLIFLETVHLSPANGGFGNNTIIIAKFENSKFVKI